MRKLVRFLLATLIGGVLLLLPIGIVIVVGMRLFAYARTFGQMAHDLLFPNQTGNLLPALFAALFLLVVAFLAGAFVQTEVGRRVFRWMEEAILARVPLYTIFAQMAADWTGGPMRLVGSASADLEVALVRFDDYEAIAFVIERGRKGKAVIYLPGAPSALSGSVALVGEDRLIHTDLTPGDVMMGLRRLGGGLIALNRRS